MKSRIVIPELMDAPDLEATTHRQALNGLRRVNRLSGTSSAIASVIRDYAHKHQVAGGTVLDLGCGSGDVAFGIANKLARGGQWSVKGWDMSLTAVDYAKQRCDEEISRSAGRRHSNNRPTFQCRDVFADTDERFDFVYCSLFLHHFENDDAKRLLQRMRELAKRMLIIDDLNRTAWGYILAWAGVRILSRSPIVHFDGPQSVRAAFSTSEIASLAESTGLRNFSLKRRWPARWILAAELSP